MSHPISSPLHGCSDRELIRQFVFEHNHQALKTLQQRHVDRMLIAICKKIQEPSLNADLVETVFHKIRNRYFNNIHLEENLGLFLINQVMKETYSWISMAKIADHFERTEMKPEFQENQKHLNFTEQNFYYKQILSIKNPVDRFILFLYLKGASLADISQYLGTDEGYIRWRKECSLAKLGN